jgi:hypothetical protein
MYTDVELAMLADRAYNYHTGSVREIEYLLDTVDKKPAIAIRGTEFDKALHGRNWLDLLRNISLFPWYDRRIGWAHAGMLKGARRLYKELVSEDFFKAFEDVSVRNRELYITGHSLGAGIGFLLAKLIASRFKRLKIKVYFVGFGTPNIMISNPAVLFPARFYRNGDDIVTELLGNFLYHRFPHTQIGDQHGFEPISDHVGMQEYIQAVEAYVTPRVALAQLPCQACS